MEDRKKINRAILPAKQMKGQWSATSLVPKPEAVHPCSCAPKELSFSAEPISLPVPPC